MQHGLKKFATDTRGFTLIDMAIALMMVGLLVAPILKQYNQQKREEARDNTVNARAVVTGAIDNFYFQSGRYPCPADPALGPDSPTYGQEDCPGAATVDGVLQGAIPFATLKVPIEASLDGWERKFLYAVSQDQSDPEPGILNYQPNGGDIFVSGIKQPSNNRCNFGVATHHAHNAPGQGAHYILASYGESGMGAYTAQGTQVQACADPNNPDAPLETENCDGDNTFFHDICSHNSEEAGLGFYDDMMLIKDEPPGRIWASATMNDNNAVTPSPYVGIGTTDPEEALDVAGNIKAEDITGDPDDDKNGYARSPELCTEKIRYRYVYNPTTRKYEIHQELYDVCTSALVVMGNEPDMKCSTNPDAIGGAISQIGYNRASCYYAFNDPDWNLGCWGMGQEDTLMAGIDSNGDPICIDAN